jgi:Leucine-rich repeat (LRR) protein
MPSRLTVVVLSLLLAIPSVVFWFWLLIQPIREEIPCPEECRCDEVGLEVNCSDSGLNRIPSTIPTHVRKLVLVGNNITIFENDSFVSKGLVDLEMLEAGFCKIRKIELGAFNVLTLLTDLSLEGNDISEIIPGTFEMMSRLEYLFLDYNRIEFLGSDTFCGLVNIKYINLEENELQYINPDTFVGLPYLQHLDLTYNPDLQIQTDRQFISSLSLKHLGISGCNINSVSVETFANVSALELLDLSYNYLRIVDISILKVLPKLSTIYLYDNPLLCDCQLQEVWRWCQDHKIGTA